MESNRAKELDQLSQFIIDSKARVGSILKTINWNEESTLQENPICKVPKETKHKTNLFPISQSTKNSVVLDSNKLQNILETVSSNSISEIRKEIPNTFDDLQRSFTRDEKLAIYNHCIERTGRLSEPEILVMIDETEGVQKQMTFAQIVAQKRDLKRRSLKYRTTKEPPLSQTEEIRNLIELQMRALSQYLNPQIEEPREEISDNKKHKDEVLASSSKTHRSRDRNSKSYRSRDSRDHSDERYRHKSSRSRSNRSRSRSKHKERQNYNKFKDSRR